MRRPDLPSATRRGLRLLMATAAFGTTASVCLGPYALTTWLRALGAGVGQVATLSIIDRCATMLALPAAFALRRRDPRTGVLTLLGTGRLAILLFPVTVALRGRGHAVPLLLLAYACATAPSFSSIGLLDAWFKDLIPRPIQARFLSRRNALMALLSAALTAGLGLAVDRAARAPAGLPPLYLGVFGLAALAGIADIACLSRVPAGSVRGGGPRVRAAAELWRRHRGAIAKAVLVDAYGFAGGWILSPFLVLLYYDLGLGRAGAGILSALGTVGVSLGLLWGGRQADRGRYAPVLRAAPLARALLHLAMAGALLTHFARGAGGPALAVVLGALTIAAMACDGAVVAGEVKFVYRIIPQGAGLAFAGIHMARNVLCLACVSGSAWLGAALARPERAAAWRARLGGGFHYGEAVLLLAAAAGLASAWALRRPGFFRDGAGPSNA